MASAMPSLHISESVFSEYVEQEGSYRDAKDKIKELVAEEIQDNDE